MKSFLLFFIVSFFFLSTETLYSKISNSILLKVGNKIVTNYEVKNKIISTLILSNQDINQKNINKIKKQSVELLIQKKVKEIELDKYEINTDQLKVNNYLNSISSNNIETLKKKFEENGIDFEIFINEIEIQFKWQKLIVNTYSKIVEINPETINQNIEQILNKQKKIEEFKLSEIEVPINNDDSDKKRIIEIKKIIDEIGFDQTALKFSISSTADNKGDLGWINSKSLSEKIFKIANNLNVGEISDPILKEGSAIILKLVAKRVSNTDTLDIEKFKNKLIDSKKNELFSLYSQSLLSKLRNTILIEYTNE